MFGILAFNEPHQVAIVRMRRGIYAIIGVRFDGKGETSVISTSHDFDTIFERFASWVGDNFEIY